MIPTLAKRIAAVVVEWLTAHETVFDNEVRGFMVRRRGGKAHYALKTRIRGRQTILTLGRHGKGTWGPERARREAVRCLGPIRDGKVPRPSAPPTRLPRPLPTPSATWPNTPSGTTNHR